MHGEGLFGPVLTVPHPYGRMRSFVMTRAGFPAASSISCSQSHPTFDSARARLLLIEQTTAISGHSLSRVSCSHRDRLADAHDGEHAALRSSEHLKGSHHGRNTVRS